MEDLRVIKDFRTMGFTAKKNDLIMRTPKTVKLVFIDEDTKFIDTITIEIKNFSSSEISRLMDCILLYTE